MDGKARPGASRSAGSAISRLADSDSIRRASASGTMHCSRSLWQWAVKTIVGPASCISNRSTLRGRPLWKHCQQMGHHRLSGVT